MPCGTTTIEGVSTANVGAVKAGFFLDSPTDVSATQQMDGSWTVTATFPPCADGAAPAGTSVHPANKALPTVDAAMAADYKTKYDNCLFVPAKVAGIQAMANRIADGRSQYQAISADTGVPWQVIGILHSRESSCNFATHLYNGDPLTARSVHVPAGRPLANPPGGFPYSFAFSADAALSDEGFSGWSDWSVSGALFMFEKFNGMGYRLHGVPSAYLWGFSQYYVKGGYQFDGVWDPNYVSNQCGCAVLWKWMDAHGMI